MIFNSKDLNYFIPSTNKYDLVENSINNLFESDFSLVAGCTPYWSDYDINDLYGILVRNGKHLGLFAYKDELQQPCFKGSIWYNAGDEDQIKDLTLITTEDVDYYKVMLVHERQNKKITLRVNNESVYSTYSGEIIDYSDAWFWIGTSCGYKIFDDNFKNPYKGEINEIGIYKKALSEEEQISLLDKNIKNMLNQDLNPVAVTDFSESTEFKVLDLSYNGNNLIKNTEETLSI